MEVLIESIKKVILLMPIPLCETLYMVLASTFFSVIFGMPLGIITAISEEGSIWERKYLNRILNGLINITRSFPFIILMIAVFPLTKIIVGKRIGTTAAIVPLTIAAIPFVARLVETAIKEISPGIIEAALSMGADVKQIVFKVMIPEALPSIASGITLTIINLIGYSAMAGVIGGGGLGNLAIRYGYQGFQKDVMIGTVIVLILMVQVIQDIGTRIYRKLLR
ncbi:methionine ABC transporter permease [Lutispora thermophila]|uniref:D-methionine transport system permease protein n=1 Tax=Lutispora thermophila DSM 19022 TaxID=1122184 RepID=A0A1M6I008_9FIRM|nr:methionine ABC transporter permease [Lutispora thermophila]SHJ27731.1 D-methionine transport system permease protein [Lutispora thermophila DSM 19022]